MERERQIYEEKQKEEREKKEAREAHKKELQEKNHKKIVQTAKITKKSKRGQPLMASILRLVMVGLGSPPRVRLCV